MGIRWTGTISPFIPSRSNPGNDYNSPFIAGTGELGRMLIFTHSRPPIRMQENA